MKSEQMYYAAFSAALMAGCEPALAQSIGYQLAYLTRYHTSDLPYHDKDSPPEPEYSCQQEHVSQPINPLNHVDWLRGGVLNQRGVSLVNTKLNPPQPKNRSYIVTPISAKLKASLTNDLSQKLNQAIMLATTELDPMALNKFCVALFHYWQAHIVNEIEDIYWMLMHAVRCYLFGTTFHWDESYVEGTALRQSTKPMYSTVEQLQQLIAIDEIESNLWEPLVDQVSYFPIAQQSQCLTLGLVFRPELIDDQQLAQPSYCDVVSINKLQAALRWWQWD